MRHTANFSKAAMSKLCHLRDICIKQILDPWILTIAPLKDFKLGFIVIEKFKLPILCILHFEDF